MLIDTHCHLDAEEFDPDRDAIVAAARAGGVEKIVVPAVHAANFDIIHSLCLRYSCVLPAYGIHPLYVSHAAESDLRVLKEILRRFAGTPFRAVAVGEIGLDFYFSGSDAARQEYFFIEQLKIAREFNLPVLLHGRRAIDAENLIRMGFCLGFGGAMTYPGSKRIRKLAASLPVENIVLESDAPDIPPVWLAGKRNSPAELPRFAGELAALRARAVEEIARQTTENAQGCLRADAA